MKLKESLAEKGINVTPRQTTLLQQKDMRGK
jgi:hypothetical protein